MPIKTIKNIVYIPMGSSQQQHYITARIAEREATKRSNPLTSDDLSRLRSKSRQICNIYLPRRNIGDYKEEDMDDGKNKDLNNEIIETFISKNIELNDDELNDSDDDDIEEKFIKREKRTNIILDRIKSYSHKFCFLIQCLLKFNNENKYNSIEINNNNNIKKYNLPNGKVLVYSDFRQIFTGGVSFIGRLLEIPDLGFISFMTFLEDETEMNNLFKGFEEEKKERMFSPKLQKLLINNFIKYIEQSEYRHYQYKVFYLWQPTNNISDLHNYMAQLIYNHIENLHGRLIRILFITKSGSEGISFEAIRQVHIIEPFWQQTRTTQVIGRAVRYKSHDDLHPDDRSVYVYEYLSTFYNNETSDNGYTTDEYIYRTSMKKQIIIDKFYNILKEASLDCPYNNENLECFSFNNIDYYNNNPNYKTLFLNNPIYSFNIKQKEYIAQLVVINNNKYIIHNNIVYDYEKYDLHKILINIGTLDTDDNYNIQIKIDKKYSNNSLCYIETDINTNINKDLFNKNIPINYDSNNCTIIKFKNKPTTISGGSDIEYIDNEDVSIYTDNTIDDDIIDIYEDDYKELYNDSTDDELNNTNEDINDYIEFVDNSTKQYSIDIKHINENNQEQSKIYKTGEYICLVDIFTNEKIIIGKINKITDKYLLISDNRIPIITETIDANINKFILYKIYSHFHFMNILGNKIFIIHSNLTDFSGLNILYKTYNKNHDFDKIKDTLYDRISQSFKKINLNIDNSDDIDEKDQIILQQIITESETLLKSNDLEQIDVLSTYDKLKLDKSKIETDYIFIKLYDSIIEIIQAYFNLIYEYIILYNKNQLIFKHPFFKKLSTYRKKLLKNTFSNDDELHYYYNTFLQYIITEISLQDIKYISSYIEQILYEDEDGFLQEDFISILFKNIPLSSIDINNIADSNIDEFTFIENNTIEQYKVNINTINNYIDSKKEINNDSDTDTDDTDNSDISDDKINSIQTYISSLHIDKNLFSSEIKLLQLMSQYINLVKEHNINYDDIEQLYNYKYINDPISLKMKTSEEKNADLSKVYTFVDIDETKIDLKQHIKNNNTLIDVLVYEKSLLKHKLNNVYDKLQKFRTEETEKKLSQTDTKPSTKKPSIKKKVKPKEEDEPKEKKKSSTKKKVKPIEEQDKLVKKKKKTVEDEE